MSLRANILASFTLFCAASTVSAGSVTFTPEIVEIVPPAVATGSFDFYAGGAYGNVDGTTTLLISANEFTRDVSGSQFGAFVGGDYTFRSNFTLGGEVAYNFGDVFIPPDPNSGAVIDNGYTSFVDFKLRAGFRINSVHVYGFGGTTLVPNYNSFTFLPPNVDPISIPAVANAGAGVQVDISDRFFIGVEYIRRWGGEPVTAAILTTEPYTDVQSVQFRAGINF